jgi:hypothetical protein
VFLFPTARSLLPSPDLSHRSCTCPSVYRLKDTNYILIQQRSPVFPSSVEKYAEEYLNFLLSLSPRHVFLLSGASTCGLSDEIFQTNRFFCYENASSSAVAVTEIASLAPNYLPELQKYQFISSPWPGSSSSRSLSALASSSLLEERERDQDEEEDLLDGSPLVSRVIQRAVDLSQVDKISFLGRYCNEGNNLSDALELAVFIAKSFQFFDLTKVKLSYPASWASLFGPPLADQSIF